MAAGDTTIYTKFIQSQANGSTLASVVDFDSDTIKIVLIDDTFTPDTTSSTIQEHFDDVSAKEVSTGTAYTGPITLANQSIALSGSVVTYDADDVAIALDGGGGFTDARYIVFYKDSGTPATSPLIAVGDLGANKDNTASSIDFTWNASGILTWTRS